MEQHNTVRNEWTDVLKTMLIDSCRERVKYMFKKPNITYNEEVNFLALMFDKKESSQDALKEFCERKKCPKETYYQFASDLENLATAAEIPENQLTKKVIERFIEGIPLTVKFELKRQYHNKQPETIFEIIELAMTVEMMKKQIDSENAAKPIIKKQLNLDDFTYYDTGNSSDYLCAVDSLPGTNAQTYKYPPNTNNTQPFYNSPKYSPGNFDNRYYSNGQSTNYQNRYPNNNNYYNYPYNNNKNTSYNSRQYQNNPEHLQQLQPHNIEAIANSTATPHTAVADPQK